MSYTTAVLLVLLGVALASEPTIEYYETAPTLESDFNHTSRTFGHLNLDYLGAGYHIIQGNPWDLQNGIDPGWKRRLVDFTYYQNWVSSDNKWVYPDGTNLFSLTNCQYGATSSSTFGTQSYYNYLNTLLSVSGSGTSGSFSASAGYQNIKATTTQSQTAYVQTMASCNAYRATLYPVSTYPYIASTAFVNDVYQLPATYDPNNAYVYNAFQNFYNNWGTHMSNEIFMGARVQYKSTFTANAYNEFLSSKIDVSAAASASWGVYSGSASSQTTQQAQSAAYFNSRRSDLTIQYLGQAPPNNGDVASWQSSVTDRPFPLKFSLVPLHTFVRTFNSGAATALEAALNDLCSKTNGCKLISNEPADPAHNANGLCRICTSCGNGFNVQRGRKLNQDDFGVWTTYGDQCSQQSYTDTWNEAQLCCAGDANDLDSGVCRFCESCGGKWPANGGNRENNGDWGPYAQYGSQCQGGYNNNGNPPNLCCNVETQCRICADSCGGNYGKEIGRAQHIGDYSSWNIYSNGCSNSKASSWSVPVFCCAS